MKPIRFAMMVQLCILLFGAPNLAHAEDLGLCVAPVFNDPEQMFDVEVQQPSRLVGAHATNVLTEYPGLILHPKNRDGIYTVTNGEYKKVPDNIASQIGRWGAGKKRVKTPLNAADLPKGFTHNDMRSEFYPELGLFLTRNANSIWYPNQIRMFGNDTSKQACGAASINARWEGHGESPKYGGMPRLVWL